MFNTRFLAATSSYLITPIGHKEEAADEPPNHNRAFCSLYLALEKKVESKETDVKKVESKETGVKKRVVSRIKERAAAPTLRQKVTSK